MPLETINRKIFILGVDGGTFELIQPMIDRGLLPTFARLMKEGASGPMRSSIPYVSPVAWATFMTGRNPGSHHIQDFTYVRKVTNTRLPVNATVLHGKTLWRLLSDAGKKVGVINVPVTFPPEKINGFMVSGFPMPTDTRNYTYPPELATELESHGWNLSDIALQSPSLDERDAFIDSLYRRQEERTQATLYLMEKYEWDVFMVHMFETDRLQHLVMNQWTRWTTQHANETDQHFAEALEKFFQAMDEVLKRIWRWLDEIAPGSTLIVMSDHGFGPVDKAVHPYNLLREAGLLRLKPTPGVGFKRALARVGFTPLNAFNWMPQGLRRQLTNDSDVAIVDSEAKSGKAGGLLPSIAKAARRSANNAILSFKDVDWERTRAYCLGNSGMIHISVNLKGRELHGIVPPEDYEKTREEIIKVLQAWRDPEDGQRIITDIYRREEIYSGPYLEEAADILAVMRGESNYYAFSGPLFLSNRSVDPYYFRDQADHRRNGILLIKDDRVPANQHIDQAQIMDLAPTVLYMLGLAVPADMEGHVLIDCFKADWLSRHQPCLMAAVSNGQSDEAAEFTAEEEASMLQQLRDLGYVE